MKNYTKKEAIQIITSTAKQYSKSLLNKNFLFIYRDRESNSIQFFENRIIMKGAKAMINENENVHMNMTADDGEVLFDETS